MTKKIASPRKALTTLTTFDGTGAQQNTEALDVEYVNALDQATIVIPFRLTELSEGSTVLMSIADGNNAATKVLAPYLVKLNKDGGEKYGVGIFFNNGSGIVTGQKWSTALTDKGINPVDGDWHTLAMTVTSAASNSSSGTYKFYLDGVEVVGSTMTGSTVNGANITGCGTQGWDAGYISYGGVSKDLQASNGNTINTNNFNGKLKDITIYDDLKTQAEISDISTELIATAKTADFGKRPEIETQQEDNGYRTYTIFDYAVNGGGQSEEAIVIVGKEVTPEEVVVDKADLVSVIAKAEALKAADYTAESYAAVQTALTAAKAANAKADATQTEVDAAKAALDAAVAKLVKATTPEPKLEPTPEKKPLEKGKKFTANGVTYKVTKSDAKNGEVAYVKTTSKAKTIIVPKTVKKDGFTYKVTSIEKNAFKNNKKVTKITLGMNVTTIGASAFQGCTALTKVTMGNNVTTINAKAFYGCAKISNITIPKNVKKIGASLFANCKKLKKITIKTTKLTKNGVAKNAFKGISKNTKIVVPSKKVAQYKSLFKSKGLSTKVKVTK